MRLNYYAATVWMEGQRSRGCEIKSQLKILTSDFLVLSSETDNLIKFKIGKSQLPKTVKRQNLLCSVSRMSDGSRLSEMVGRRGQLHRGGDCQPPIRPMFPGWRGRRLFPVQIRSTNCFFWRSIANQG